LGVLSLRRGFDKRVRQVYPVRIRYVSHSLCLVCTHSQYVRTQKEPGVDGFYFRGARIWPPSRQPGCSPSTFGGLQVRLSGSSDLSNRYHRYGKRAEAVSAIASPVTPEERGLPTQTRFNQDTNSTGKSS